LARVVKAMAVCGKSVLVAETREKRGVHSVLLKNMRLARCSRILLRRAKGRGTVLHRMTDGRSAADGAHARQTSFRWDLGPNTGGMARTR